MILMTPNFKCSFGENFSLLLSFIRSFAEKINYRVHLDPLIHSHQDCRPVDCVHRQQRMTAQSRVAARWMTKMTKQSCLLGMTACRVY